MIEFGVSSSGLYYSIWVGHSGDGVKKVDLGVGGVQEADSALGCIEDAICNEVVEETSQSDSTSSSSSSSWFLFSYCCGCVFGGGIGKVGVSANYFLIFLVQLKKNILDYFKITCRYDRPSSIYLYIC